MRPEFQEPGGPKRLSFNNIKLRSRSASLSFDPEKRRLRGRLNALRFLLARVSPAKYISCVFNQ